MQKGRSPQGGAAFFVGAGKEEGDETAICREIQAVGEYEVRVLCERTYSENVFPSWLPPTSYWHIWDVSTGKVTGDGGDISPRGRVTGTATITIMGRQIEVSIEEASWTNSWVDEDGFDWRETCSRTIYHHQDSGVPLQWTDRAELYVFYEGRDWHECTKDFETFLTDTNLDL